MLRFIAGFVTAVFLVTVVWMAVKDRVLPLPKATPLAIIIERAKPAEKTVYAEAYPVVQITGKEPRFFNLLESQRLLIAGGHCTAGINFEKDAPQFQTDPTGMVTIRVIEPELFGCGITEQKFFDGTGIIPASQELSNDLSNQVMPLLAESAVRSGILKVARDSAASRIELRLRQVADSLGANIADVWVEFIKR